MPEESGQLGGTLAYVASLTTTTSNVASVQGMSKMSTPQRGSIVFYQTLTNGGFFQKDSFDIGGTFTPADRTTVTITKDGQATDYVNQVQTGETFEQVLKNLVSRIGLDPDLSASYEFTGSQGTVTVHSVTGENYTIAVTSTGDMTTGSVASVGTGSGSAAVKMRKLAEVEVNYSLSPQGNPQVADTFKFYDGAETGALVQSLSLSSQRHPQNISTIQSNNGA